MSSENLLNYIWDTQINPQMGYSFSQLHSYAYSLISLQEMNLAHRFPRIYWDTACLTVSAGSDEDSDSNKATDYGKIAASIGRLKTQGVNVALPDINMAGFGFTPDEKGNRIIFGLRGINGVGDGVAHAIIEHRPYKSFEDFHERLYETKIIQRSHMLKLIKAGCFNEFHSPIETMKRFIVKEVDVKDTLNGQNLPRIVNLGLLDTPDLVKYKDYYNFRRHIMKSVHEHRNSPKDKIYIIEDDYSQIFFENNFDSENTIKNKQGSRTEAVVVGTYKNRLLISDKAFKRQYDAKMEAITELYTDENFIRNYNNGQFLELWKQYAGNSSIASWEMESVSFYSEKHELEDIDTERYGISNFFKIDETPVVTSTYQWRGRTIEKIKLHTIVGTVLDKNKNTHSFSVLTPSGVVHVKTYSGAYSHYDKQISTTNKGKKTVVESSWLARGELLLLSGFRRQDQFVLRAERGQHTINKITEVRPDGSIGLQNERARA